MQKTIFIDNVKDNPKNLDVITIKVVDVDGVFYEITSLVYPGQNLMELLKEIDFPMGHCGGMALCASCHCFLESNMLNYNISSAEEDMLDQLYNSDPSKSRLICQIPVSKELDGILLKIVGG